MAQGTCDGTSVLGKHDRRSGAISLGNTRALRVDQLTPSTLEVPWHSADLTAG